MPTTDPKADIRLRLQQDSLHIDIVGSFRDDIWSNRFGDAIKTIRRDNAIRTVHLNLGACHWADPLPLLSSLIALKESVEKGIAVRATLPEGEDEAARSFRNFLDQDGFLDQMREIGADVVGANASGPQSRYADPSPPNAHCIPMQVIDTPALETADERIEFRPLQQNLWVRETWNVS